MKPTDDAKAALPGRASAGLTAVLPKNSLRRVVVLFVILFAALLQLVTSTLNWPVWTAFTSFTADVATKVAQAIGVNAHVTGNLILLPSRTLSVDTQCTAYTLAVLYIALVLAYPLGARTRMLALAVGIPVLFVANITRLTVVAYASERLAERPFMLVHDYLMEFGMVFVLVMLWAVWLSLARER